MRILIWLVNAFLLVALIGRVVIIDDDKAHLLFLFYCPALALFNLIIGFILKMIERPIYKTFYLICTWLACLFIPVYIVLLSI